MKIPTHQFTKSDLIGFKKFLDQQVINQPSDELLEMYEKRILHELSYLRAERYDSPEHQKELKQLQKEAGNDKIPRNNQNPNYDKLIGFYEKLIDVEGQKKKKPANYSIHQVIEILNELYQFLISFSFFPHFELKLAYLSPLVDPRCVQEDPNLYLCYLLTKFRDQILLPREAGIFNQLTEEVFDDESITGTLTLLRESKNDPSNFRGYANQILEAIESKVKYSIPESSDPSPPDIPEDAESLIDFLNYLYCQP